MSESTKKHEIFIKETKDYIRECLKNKVNPNTILESFGKIIDETVDETLKENTKK